MKVISLMSWFGNLPNYGGAVMQNKNCIISYLFRLSILIIFIFFNTPAFSSQVTLAWNANTEPDIDGYKLYYGTSSGDYQFIVDVNNQTTHTLTGLTENVLYYFAVTAYNLNGFESDYSNQVKFGNGGYDPGEGNISSNSGNSGNSGGGNHNDEDSIRDPKCVDDSDCYVNFHCDESQYICLPNTCKFDSDCDNGIFCNGDEECKNGTCVAGEIPCYDDQICKENLEECRDSVMISVENFAKNIRRPLFREKRLKWLMIKCEEDVLFDNKGTKITIEHMDGIGSGIEVDGSRIPIKIGNIIFIPLLLSKDAVIGQYIIRIETRVENDDDLLDGIIETTLKIK
jgi:hypothetical protein